ncbi:MAG: hypothetical protein Q8O64_14440 [Sideroxyarcus sp.]|nr:hypothetical protein [Sideroxyarcus sp.]
MAWMKKYSGTFGSPEQGNSREIIRPFVVSLSNHNQGAHYTAPPCPPSPHAQLTNLH